jgi:hypothetical protein
MLVHCFWLLEFKFEFYCLNPFSNFLHLLPSLPYSFFAFSPTPLVAQQQPVFFFSFTLQAGLAAQQASCATH